MQKKSKANFLYRIGEVEGVKFLLIKDHDLGERSVTNDIENVVEDIAVHEGIDPKLYTIIYRDSSGRWDGWNHRSKRFFSLKPDAMPWHNIGKLGCDKVLPQ